MERFDDDSDPLDFTMAVVYACLVSLPTGLQTQGRPPPRMMNYE
jgi:hypothetical protein